MKVNAAIRSAGPDDTAALSALKRVTFRETYAFAVGDHRDHEFIFRRG